MPARKSPSFFGNLRDKAGKLIKNWQAEMDSVSAEIHGGDKRAPLAKIAGGMDAKVMADSLKANKPKVKPAPPKPKKGK
jgi:hypothetical protein